MTVVEPARTGWASRAYRTVDTIVDAQVPPR